MVIVIVFSYCFSYITVTAESGDVLTGYIHIGSKTLIFKP